MILLTALLLCLSPPGCGPASGDKKPLANGGINGLGSGDSEASGGGLGGSTIGSGGQEGSGVIELVGLFAGAQIQGGSPKVRDLAPAGEAPPSTLVVAVFSESVSELTVNATSFTLREDSASDPSDPFGGGFGGGSGQPVLASISFPDGTGKRVAVLRPLLPLNEGQYSIRVADTVTDLEGKSLKVSGSGSDESDGDDDGGGGFGGDFGDGFGDGFGGGGGETESELMSVAPDAAFGAISMFPLPGSKNNPRDTDILLFFNRNVSTSQLKSIQVQVDGDDVGGKWTSDGDARMGRFTPKNEFPLGAEVDVSFNGLTGSGGGGAASFDASFTVSNIPTPTSINLPDNAPLGFGGVEFDGRVTSNNAKKFRSVVNLSKGNADSVTLLFFQQQGLQGSAARAFTKKEGGGKAKFNVNLSKGGDDSQFRDSTDVTPPSPVFLGAFATKGGANSPVGPMPELLTLFVKTTKPSVVFGPPLVDEPYVLRHDLAEPVIYGNANETLASLRAIVNASTIPAELSTIPFQGPASVTDSRHFFMTQLAKSTLPGFPVPDGPMFQRLNLDEITFTDVVGNEVSRTGDKAGYIQQEGSVGGPLSSDSMDGLKVRVVRARDLAPLKNADVQVESATDPLLPVLKRSTNKNGVVGFATGELMGLGDALSVSVWKSGHDAVTVFGVSNPGRGGGSYGISIPIRKTGKAQIKATVHRADHVPVNSLPNSLAGVSANGATPMGEFLCTACVEDERYVLQSLDESQGAKLELSGTRPTVVSAFEHDGVADVAGAVGNYALRTTEVLVPVGDEDIQFSFGELAPQEFLVKATLPPADVTAAGITEDPVSSVRGRLIAVVPGLSSAVPLGFSRASSLGGDMTVAPPIPRSLFVDEPLFMDPMVELLMHPPSGSDLGAPPKAILEEQLRLEVEASEEGTSRLTRLRAPLNVNTAGMTATVLPFEDLSGFLLPVPVVNAAREEHPPMLQFANLDDYDTSLSLLRLVIQRPGDSRRWTLLIDPEAIDAMTPELVLPALPTKPFKTPGDFEVTTEILEFDAFDIDSFVFSELERRHRRLARSAAVSFNTEED